MYKRFTVRHATTLKGKINYLISLICGIFFTLMISSRYVDLIKKAVHKNTPYFYCQIVPYVCVSLPTIVLIYYNQLVPSVRR